MFDGNQIRIKRKKLGLSAEELAGLLKVDVGRLYKWEKGHKPSDPEEFLRLQKWLKTPSESILKNGTLSNESYQDKLFNHKADSKKDIPVFGGFTTLGNIQVYDDENVKNKIVGHLPTEFFPNCDYAERAKGDSMYPLIMNQALLIGKTCTLKGIAFGEKYIIKTRDGMDTTKFVHPGNDPDTIKLKAYNKSVPDQEIQITEIVFICRVHWIVNPT